ncbi:uncharacterized protein [Salmo salar]|uniref:Uncharacterized protein n=1 Tax=Salmo salar TaxID=8030 RepID=A0ABM3DJI8_SALSA|nr:uncharacterized protein LOC123729135 [Salmo salar]
MSLVLIKKMADGREGGAAVAASHMNAVILSKTSGVRRPQLNNSCKDLKRNYVFYLQYISMIVSYEAALLIISVRPCWDDTINLLPENINTKHIGSPFHGSGQYTAYHNVLNNGQVYLAPYSTDLLRRNKHKSNIYRKLLNYLFSTLLLYGDVQLNPGPNITEPAILTGVESSGWPRPLIVAAAEVDTGDTPDAAARGYNQCYHVAGLVRRAGQPVTSH